MKSNYIQNRGQSERIAKQVAREEIARQKAFMCPDCQMNTVYQTLATAFVILQRRYRFTAKTLNAIKNDIEDEFTLMETGFLGRDYTANQLVQALQEIGVDFGASKYN